MTPSVRHKNSWPAAYRQQPVWLCFICNAWEPRDGWRGELPAGWDGERWTEPA